MLQTGDAVVVVPNYRLGALGWLSSWQLDALGGGGGNHTGDAGFLDQRAALRWAKENAAAFGGDPGSVTVFGQSAGGMSIASHLIMPGSKGLFQKGGGSRCELYVSAQEVGTLQSVTVAYAHNAAKPDGSVPVFAAWRLQQVIVRHGGDGIVTCFPASVELKGPKALLELLPRLSWHEDMYGNCAERPPPPPPGALAAPGT